MNSGTVGVAISTTGDEHRLGFLETCIERWRQFLPLGGVLVITVDGDERATNRVYEIAGSAQFGNVYRVGQGRDMREGHQGVAVNKNTGIELLMDQQVQHLFLCDDDTWPIHEMATKEHINLGLPHSMVCWGLSRLLPRKDPQAAYATWKWPRGVMLYTHCAVIEHVGGMVEDFGFGGHEHAEWSRRIHQAGLTPASFVTPALYANDNGRGARLLWNCEDMRKPGEHLVENGARRKAITSVRRKGRDWTHIDKIMSDRDGDTSFVPYNCYENGRSSATLWTHLSDDQGVVQAKEPGSE